MSEPYQIGRCYRVPTVHGILSNMERDWPVFLPIHEDTEIIEFPYWHYHVDWRFVAEKELRMVSGFYVTENYDWAAAVPLMERNDGYLATLNVGLQNFPVVYKRLKCRRDPVGFPQTPGWIAALEAKHHHCKAKHGICPHRGVDMTSIPPVDGIVTCPAHGLRWRAETWELVPHGVARP